MDTDQTERLDFIDPNRYPPEELAALLDEVKRRQREGLWVAPHDVPRRRPFGVSIQDGRVRIAWWQVVLIMLWSFAELVSATKEGSKKRPPQVRTVQAAMRSLAKLSDWVPGANLRKTLKKLVADEHAEILELAKARRGRVVTWRLWCVRATWAWYVAKGPAQWIMRLIAKRFVAN